MSRKVPTVPSGMMNSGTGLAVLVTFVVLAALAFSPVLFPRCDSRQPGMLPTAVPTSVPTPTVALAPVSSITLMRPDGAAPMYPAWLFSW